MRALFSMVLLSCALVLVSGVPAAQASAARPALVLQLDGAIGPATVDYVRRGLSEAARRGAVAVVLRVDTPGGLDRSMRQIIRDILASPVPVLAFVAPSGARAASAGTFILYASHVAAMAPGTTLGAATPVAIGMDGAPGEDGSDKGREEDREGGNGSEKGRRAPQPGTAAERKAINDAAAYIRGLADLRGRNAEWAEQAVREAASLSAKEALELKVVDLMASDVEGLLARAHGRTVSVAGAPVTLDTAGLVLEAHDPDWRTRLLAAITDPTVALILMMIGVYGLIFEFMNPGALVPGTIGAISLLVGLYALAALPVNYAGLALMLLGIGLMVAEALSPSFGILGLGGVVAFVLGATILIDTDFPAFRITWPVVAGIGLFSLGFTLLVARLAVTSQRRPVVSGREHMLGGEALVQDWSGTTGHVGFEGERWRAASAVPLLPGQRVRVLAIEGLTLTVAPEHPETREYMP